MAATWYCWSCYAKQDGEAPQRCPHCGRSPRAPATASYTDKLLWALGHPLTERRMIAAAALGERCEPRAHASLKKMANDPDPYLAATAVRALTLYPDAEVMATLEAVAKRGPAPVRRVARRFIASR